MAEKTVLACPDRQVWRTLELGRPEDNPSKAGGPREIPAEGGKSRPASRAPRMEVWLL